MLKYVVLVGLISSPALAGEKSVYTKVKQFNPKMEEAYAKRLSRVIYKEATKAGLDPLISVAILAQESSLRNINAKRKYTKTVHAYCTESECFKTTIETEEVTDLSIAQISQATARDYKLDVERLYNLDLEYAIKSHFVILKQKMELCKELAEPWSCYHSKTEKHRLKYIRDVSRHL